MKQHTLKHIASSVFFFLLLIVGIMVFPELTGDSHAYAAEGDIQVVGTPTAYVVTGGTADMVIKLKNTTSRTLEYVSIWESSVEGTGEDAFTPYTFQDKRKSPEPENAIISGTIDETYYAIAAGQTATFHILVSARNLDPGTYNHFVQFANWHYEYEYDEWGWPISSTKVLDEYYSTQIPVKTVIYNPPDASLAVGRSTNQGAEVTPFPSSGIDLGSIDLRSSEDFVLNLDLPFFFKNTSPTVDTHVSARPDITLIQGTSMIHPAEYVFDSPISYDNGYGLWSYDTTLGPDAPHRVAVTANATYFIAGTYTADVVIETVPHKVKINGVEGNNSGFYTIPVTLELTGINPRLPARATNLQTKPGNHMVELTWQPSAEDGAAEVNYYVYRRDGIETNTDPDTWTVEDWSRYEKLNFNWVSAKGDGTYLYVDGTAENDKTYSYVVIADEPFKGYASAPKSATPDASIQSRLLAPDNFAVSDEVDSVILTWIMNEEQYGGSDNDGSGMVDHFNIYQDGVLVKKVYQSAVIDDVTQGWIDDGNGNSHWGITSHSYSWETTIDMPLLGQNYVFEVACVDKNGVEGYRSEWQPGMGLPETVQLVGQEVRFDPDYYDEDTDEYIPAMTISMKTLEDGSTTETLTFWRNEGTSASDTNNEPYAVTDKNDTSSYGAYDFVDTDVRAGRVYTYTVQATDNDGDKSTFYTFTAAASVSVDFSTSRVTWKVIDGQRATMSWYSDYYYDNDGGWHWIGSYKVSRSGPDGTKEWAMSPVTEGEFKFEDDPGTDGTYVYRMDKQYKIGNTTYTIPGQEFIFVRNTTPPDEDAFLKPPKAPTLNVRVSEGYPILSWTPDAEGDEPEGYHIYRTDGEEEKMGGRYVAHYHWDGYSDDWESWGNSRYLTIQDGSETQFVDGFSGYYKNDKYLGRTEEIRWEEDYCPHVYWITAYNSAGESERSQVFTFGYAGSTIDEEGYEHTNIPTTPATEGPASPEITKMWVDWEDISQGTSAWDTAIMGYVRVAWDDPGHGGDIDQWNIETTGTSTQWIEDFTEPVTYAEVLHDPSLKQGGKKFDRASVDARTGEYGDYGRTVTMTVSAQNSVGESKSEPKSMLITSFPRFRTVSGNSEVKLEWTDLFNDTTTQVTDWEIWRKTESGAWSQLTTLAAGDITYAAEDRNGTKSYAWLDTEVTNGQTYEYKVIAKCADSIDRESVIRQAEPVWNGAVEAPGVPENFSYTVLNGEVVFTWNPPTTGGAPQYYKVMYYNEDYSMWYSAGSVQAPSTSAVWAPSQAGTYRCFVYDYSYINNVEVPERADFWDTSDVDLLYPSHSGIINVEIGVEDIRQQTDQRPYGPLVTATPGDGQVTLSWTINPEGGTPTYFEVVRYSEDGTSGIGTVTIPATGTQFTYTDTTAVPGVRYRYVVTAYNSAGQSSSDVYARAVGKTPDQIAADKVTAQINMLPDADVLTVENYTEYEDQIDNVYAVYNSLTQKQKNLVNPTAKNKLIACINRLEEIRLYIQYAEQVDSIQALINAIPDPDTFTEATLQDQEVLNQISEAREAYDSLTPAAVKNLVDAARLIAAENKITELRQAAEDREAYQPVIEMIEELPECDEITVDNVDEMEELVAAAREAYENLTARQQNSMKATDAGSAAVSKLEALEARIEKVKREKYGYVMRIYGSGRYETAFLVADQLKEKLGVEEFDAVILADGRNYPDALAGSYLSSQFEAPILLVNNRHIPAVQDYIRENMTEEGTIYILGGTGAVPDDVMTGMDDYTFERLAGASRYETNLEILNAGPDNDKIVVCTGKDYADSLSASAVGRPILLVKNTLQDNQKAYLETLEGEKTFYIIGGEGAVTKDVENALKAYGTVKRVFGASRYDTSVAVAEEFFPEASAAVLAYGQNFPDGLCGGALAYYINGADGEGAPLILTRDSKAQIAAAYTTEKNITKGAVLGGTTLISDESVSAIFGIDPEDIEVITNAT